MEWLMQVCPNLCKFLLASTLTQKVCDACVTEKQLLAGALVSDLSPVIFIQYTVCGKEERIVRCVSLAPLCTFPEDDLTQVGCLTGFFPWCSIFTWKSFGVL